MPKLNKRKTIFCVAGLLILALLIFQFVIDLSVYRSLVQVRPDNDTVIATLIDNSTKNLNKPAPVDAASGKVYIPEAHLVLPAYTGFGQIEYMYESGQYTSNNATEIHLTTSAILNLAKDKMWAEVANSNNRMAWQSYNPSAVFNAVPSLQACTRGVQVFYSKQNLSGDYAFQGSHKLKDGRTLYVYSEGDCKQDQSPVIDLAIKAESY